MPASNFYIYRNSSIFNDSKCLICRAYIPTIKDEKITFCEYTTQRFMFYTFFRYTFHLKNKGKTVIEYKILKYRKLKII